MKKGIRKRKSKFHIEKYDLRPKRARAGIGLFTFSPIVRGKCVIEYKGRLLSEAEELTSNSLYLFEVTKKKTIDGRARSNLARYINHSCRPNCEVLIYKGRVYIMARRAIRPGEELTYDYGHEYFDEHITKRYCKCDKCRERRSGKKRQRR